jgi:predicted anti-sigma-YlaC factor YlaD
MNGAADIACRELVELVTDYLDAALPAADRQRLEEHLVFCPGCLSYLEQVRRTSELLGRLEEPAPPSPAVRDALLRAFREQPGSAAP